MKHTDDISSDLKREIGVSAFSMSVVNASIGAGMFALPAIIGIQLGGFGIFCYIFCGLLLAVIMLCYAEAGTRITTTGGSYAYVEAAFGPLPGYIINWLFFFGWGILSDAAILNVLADTLAIYNPAFHDGFLRALLFFGLLATMAIINIFGVKHGARIVQIMTIMKLIPLAVIILFGVPLINGDNLVWEQIPTLKTFSDSALVLFFAFAGFETTLNVSGEVKEPHKVIPRGLLIGGLTAIIFIMLIQIVVQGVIGAEIVQFKDAPVAAVAQRIFGPSGMLLVIFATVMSCSGIVTGDVLASPRLLYAGALDGLFPKFLSKIHAKHSTPFWAILVYSCLIFIFSVSGGFKQLAVMASTAILIIYLSVILSVIRLRRKQNDNSSPVFTVPGGLLIPILGIGVILWLLTSLSRFEMLFTISFIAIVCLLYYGQKKIQK